MDNAFLKKLISFKLKNLDKIIEKLPNSVGKIAKNMELNLLSAIHEVTGNYTVETNKKNKDKSIKSISIE